MLPDNYNLQIPSSMGRMLCSLRQEGKGQPFSHNFMERGWQEREQEVERTVKMRCREGGGRVIPLFHHLSLYLPGGLGRGGWHPSGSRCRLSSASIFPLLYQLPPWGHFSPQTSANKSLASLGVKGRQWEIDREMCTLLRKDPLTSDSYVTQQVGQQTIQSPC